MSEKKGNAANHGNVLLKARLRNRNLDHDTHVSVNKSQKNRQLNTKPSRERRDKDEIEAKVDEFLKTDFGVKDTGVIKQREPSKRSFELDLKGRLLEVTALAVGSIKGVMTGRYKRYAYAGVAALAVVLLIGVSVWFDDGTYNPNEQPAATTEVKGTAQQVVEPEFKVGVSGNGPDGEVQYDPEKRVSSYPDSLKEASFIVSQQQLPEESLNDPTLALKAAQGFGLNKSINTDKGELFIGTDVEQGIQFLLFRHKAFLVLIQSDTTLEDADWVSYVEDFNI